MKKLAVILLVFAIAASVFAGGTSEEADRGGAPAAKLSVSVFERGNIPEDIGTSADNPWTDWIQEQMLAEYNIDVRFVGIARTQEREMLNTLMAAGDAPDIIGTYFSDLIQNYISQGGLADLSEAVEMYGPNLVELIGQDVLETYGQVGGKQYMIPGRTAFLGIFADYIRKDWLDVLGLDMPTTRDEWLAAIRMIKEEDPGNVGSENIIGYWLDAFTVYGLGQALSNNLLMSFVTEMTEEEWYSLPDLLKPGYKEGVRFLNQLYDERLINQEFALETTPDGYNEAMANNYIASAFTAYWELFRGQSVVTLLETTPSAFYEAGTFFENYEGEYVRELRSPVGMQIVVPTFSKSVNEAVKYLDWLSIPEVGDFLWHGEEGVHHKVIDGVKVLLPPEQRGSAELPWANSWDLSIVRRNFLGDPSTPEGMQRFVDSVRLPLELQGQEAIADMQETGIRVSLVDGFVPPHFPRPIDAAGRYGSVLIDKHVETIIRSVMADPSDFDAVYDRLVEEYLNAGGRAVVDERRAVYREMIAD